MRRGFAYDAALCVNCKTCSAACILENGFQPGIRTVYSWNESAASPFSVISLSLACNHCAEPSCLSGCPAKAYTTDDNGTVIHHTERCMGCRYCTLKCPYGAPKVNIAKGYIEKCHFCHERAAEGVEPACVTACPTGAIKIIYADDFPEPDLEWFPQTGIGPSVRITGAIDRKRPLIVPPEEVNSDLTAPYATDKIWKEWSLLLFSLLIVISSAAAISSYFTGDTLLNGTSFLTAILAMAVSMFHLGVKVKAYRAILNLISSPLSREIAAVALLAVSSGIAYLKPSLLPPLVVPAVAVLTLMAVDLVYLSADRSRNILLHSGQVLFSGVFAVSFFAGSLNIFLLMTLLAAGSTVLRSGSTLGSPLVRNLYYYRAMTLPLVLMLLYLTGEWATFAAGVLFFTGLVADRALYYDDFEPENINYKISQHFYSEYEKERDKQRENTGLS